MNNTDQTSNPTLDNKIDDVLQLIGCTCYHESGCDINEYRKKAKKAIKSLIQTAEEEAYKKGYIVRGIEDIK